MDLDVANYDDFDDIGKLKTSFDMLKYLRSLSERFDLAYFLVLATPPDMSGGFAKNRLICNWPMELVRLYDQADMVNESPVLSALRQSSTPVFWHYRNGKPSTALGRIHDAFRKRGFVRGIGVPVTNPQGLRGLVDFAGNRSELEQGAVLRLSMISTRVFDRLCELNHLNDEAKSPLNSRELECLKWTAGGKTSVEIAAIIGLSEHTVNRYLKGAIRKLEAVNRTQAVANAVRRGYIM